MSRRHVLARGCLWADPPEDDDECEPFAGDDFDIPDEPVADAYAADRAADLYQRDLDRVASQ